MAGKYAGNASFLRMMLRANQELAAKLGVTGAPTVVFFKAGQELGARLSGEEIKRTDLKARVEALVA